MKSKKKPLNYPEYVIVYKKYWTSTKTRWNTSWTKTISCN